MIRKFKIREWKNMPIVSYYSPTRGTVRRDREGDCWEWLSIGRVVTARKTQDPSK